ARILLVGDIDRGGVFASFIGHVSTFCPEELDLFSGFLVNKFRGDPVLLGDAFAMTLDRTGFPVLGCVPMLSGLDIPDEDEPVVKAGDRPGADLRIAVPRLRHVSNFTDLDAFAAEPDVQVVPVSRGDELAAGRWDAVIIPGSKSTVADLGWLRESGLADSIIAYARGGGTVTGICGGYQMLGRRIFDPDGVESPERSVDGLGLLALETAFSVDKTLARSDAVWLDDGSPLAGYEIHHGNTTSIPQDPGDRDPLLRPAVRTMSSDIIGYRSGAVWGSYLHGIFDTDGFRRAFLNGLRERRGLAPLPIHPRPSLDENISRLADAVRESVDLGAIRRELGL
ncbi:MAG: cobyric acid synthase, partial [Spirochaetales bacterium]